jgi:hypothetical protein
VLSLYYLTYNLLQNEYLTIFLNTYLCIMEFIDAAANDAICSDNVKKISYIVDENVLYNKSKKNTKNKKSNSRLAENEPKKEDKVRVKANKWKFEKREYLTEKQLDLLKCINCPLSDGTENDAIVIKTIISEINNKLSSYKQQDKIKNRYDITKFITLNDVVDNMLQCKLICKYCNECMDVLYNISREMKQWTVDRIDNDLGHNGDNFHLACLECNLKRRRRTDEKFLFTKQLKISKLETSGNNYDNDNNYTDGNYNTFDADDNNNAKTNGNTELDTPNGNDNMDEAKQYDNSDYEISCFIVGINDA